MGVATIDIPAASITINTGSSDFDQLVEGQVCQCYDVCQLIKGRA
jgi:hypothetical protein